MKQIVQSARSGELELLEVPAPAPDRGQVLVRTHFSLVPPGTEKSSLDFARKSRLGKARSRPDLVKQVARKLRQEGPVQTYRAVMGRLDSPQPLGYSCAGVVEAVGAGVTTFAPGDRVACGGAGYANHAELNVVPENLCVAVPNDLPLEKAAYATVGAIALQAVRLAEPTLGEVVAVIGLGLIGQITVQLLRANGCRVLGVDTQRERIKQSLDMGAEWALSPDEIDDSWADRATGGHGADFAVVAASADSSAPIELAARLCRLKGRIVLVGTMPIDLDRRWFFEKELEFKVSMSYGPGRYDRRYEEMGLDYPLAYVRWTENRNMQAFLGLAATGSIHPDRLDTEIVDFSEAEQTYEALARGERRHLSILFRYESGTAAASRSIELEGKRRSARDSVGIAFVGAGNYAKSVLLPALQAASGTELVSLVTATGASARRTGERFGFARCGTEAQATWSDPAVDLVFITTRHDSHAELAVAALEQGKSVWLEKPVGLVPDQVDAVVAAARSSEGLLTVGYNRRFSPHTRVLKQAFASRSGPMALHYVVAPGPPPQGSWMTDPDAGGGRIVGEVCHFVDLCIHLTGLAPVSVFARALGRDPERDDSVVASLGFEDGSTATIEYLALASTNLPKERIEISCGGRTGRCENFKSTSIEGSKSFRTLNQDKGQRAAVDAMLDAIRSGGPAPIPLNEIAATSAVCFAIQESIRRGEGVSLQP